MQRNAGGPGAPAALLQHVFGVVRKWYISIDYHHVGFIGSALGEPAWHCASAFVLQVEERCLLFTAGHVIQHPIRGLALTSFTPSCRPAVRYLERGRSRIWTG
jgi:hypothetical protein